MVPIYKFTLNDNAATPNYSADLSLEYEKESQQLFFRRKLSGKVTFLGHDYQYIMDQDFETEFFFKIFKSNDGGITWDEYYTGRFMKTDCEFDLDDHTITVQPDVWDDYKPVMDVLEKEFNLIKLNPVINTIEITKRPILQTYIPGDSVITCYLTNGVYWEIDTSENVTDTSALVNTYKFVLNTILTEINVTVTGQYEDASGVYVGRLKATEYSFNGVTYEASKWEGVLYKSGDSAYKVSVKFESFASMSGNYRTDIDLYYNDTMIFSFISLSNSPEENFDFNFSPAEGVTGTAKGELADYLVFVRYLTDVESINPPNPTPALPENDIAGNVYNYKYVAQPSPGTVGDGYISNNYSDEPTEWGIADNSKYFAPPVSTTIGSDPKFMPMARSTWRYASVWFAFGPDSFMFDTPCEEGYNLRDAHPIESVISVLLKEIAPDITHDGTAEYSEFLYGSSQYSFGHKLFITQKTNILKGEYDQPAQKAEISLQQVTSMLASCFQAYWFIEDGKFKVEQIAYFMNGGSYTQTTRQISYDLTKYKNLRNGKMWGFAQSTYKFSKIDMPQEYVFEWMDEVSQPFTGNPIEIDSKYVTEAKQEDITVSNFSSDIDYMLLTPDNFGEDGFALLAADVAEKKVDENPASPDFYAGIAGYYDNTGTFVEDDGYRSLMVLVSTANGMPIIVNGTGSANVPIAVFFGTKTDENGVKQKVFLGKDNGPNATLTSVVLQDYTLSPPEGTKYIAINRDLSAVPTTVQLSISGYNYKLPVMYFTPSGEVAQSWDYENLKLQNGFLSFLYLIRKYWVYNMPAPNIKVNGSEITAMSLSRNKEQEIYFPSLNDPDTNMLIRTELGDGEIAKLSVNLSSRMNKVTLKYDTE